MADYLLDTNHASRLMASDARLVAKVRQADPSADFGVSMTVVGELYFAVYASQHRQRNLRRLARLLRALRVYAFDQLAAEEFGRIQAEQKTRGRPIPPLDAQIAAVARQHNLTVLTADKHFDTIDRIHAENWLGE